MFNIVNCDNCKASEYSGYSKGVDEEEYCLMFQKKLKENEEYITLPCEECAGKYFRQN